MLVLREYCPAAAVGGHEVRIDGRGEGTVSEPGLCLYLAQAYVFSTIVCSPLLIYRYFHPGAGQGVLSMASRTCHSGIS